MDSAQPGEFPRRLLSSDTPHSDGLPAETEAEFAAALDQAVEGQPIYVPAEVAAAFGLHNFGPDSAEAADVQERPWIRAVPETSDSPAS